MSVHFPVALLFFLVGLFVPADRFIPFMAGLLFFLVHLFVLFAFSDETLFFLLNLSVFAFLSIMSLFLISMGLFDFQIGGLVTLVGICIFHNKYVTLCIFKKGEYIFRHQLLDFLANLILEFCLHIS